MDTPNSCAQQAAHDQLRASVRILESAVTVLESTQAYKASAESSGDPLTRRLEGDTRITGVISSILSLEMRLKELTDQV